MTLSSLPLLLGEKKPEGSEQKLYPKLIKKVDPQYSPQARRAGVQGMVVLSLEITPEGKPQDIRVVSPLGFGLDEQAEIAVQQWRFQPAHKDGQPVTSRAEAQINFRFLNAWFDEKAERRRAAYNSTLQRLQLGADNKAAVVEMLESLVKDKYPPALHLYGSLLREGEYAAKDEERAVALFREAAAKDYGPAMYEIGARHISGKENPSDPELGWKMIADASLLGSMQAQVAMGLRYEKGVGVPADPTRARRSYRLCAANGMPVCQWYLARLLLQDATRPDWERLQGIAWLQLAADNGVPEAKKLLETETASLTPEQTKRVSSWRTQLLQKKS